MGCKQNARFKVQLERNWNLILIIFAVVSVLATAVGAQLLKFLRCLRRISEMSTANNFNMSPVSSVAFYCDRRAAKTGRQDDRSTMKRTSQVRKVTNCSSRAEHKSERNDASGQEDSGRDKSTGSTGYE